jgi:hypothetical protein
LAGKKRTVDVLKETIKIIACFVEGNGNEAEQA